LILSNRKGKGDNMFTFKSHLHRILNEMKSFATGYSTSNNNQMIIQYEDKVYLAEFTELGNGETSDYMYVLRK
jgi:hypothetical protein